MKPTIQQIQLAWGEYYPSIKDKVDNFGWYDGSNDKVQKQFDKIEVEKSRFHQRPISLRSDFVPKASKITKQKQVEDQLD